jgi:hypothetical protein
MHKSTDFEGWRLIVFNDRESVNKLNSFTRTSLLTFGGGGRAVVLPHTNNERMKKAIMGAALFLLIGLAQASASGVSPAASGVNPAKGQPGTQHNILSSQLPGALLTDIKKEYKDYWITECSEIDKKKKADYFITLENSDQIVQLRSSDSENWVLTNTSVKVD